MMNSLNCLVDTNAIKYEIDGKLYYTYDKRHYEELAPRFLEIKPFFDGLAPVNVYGKWGYISMDGGIVITPQYDRCMGFQDGVAVVYDKGEQQEKHRLIDREGNALTVWMDYLGSYLSEEGLRRIKVNGKWGFADLYGSIVIKPQYTYCLDFAEGLAPIEIKKGKWGYIDAAGNVAIAPTFTFARHFTNGIAPVFKDKTLFFIDKNGIRTNPPPKQDNVEDEIEITVFDVQPDCAKFQYSTFIQNDKVGIIDSNGNIVLEPLFEDAKMLNEKIVGVQWRGKWDIIFLS